MSNTYSLTTSVGPNAKRTSSNFTGYGASSMTWMCWVKTSTDNAANAMILNINNGSTETMQFIKRGDNSYHFTVSAGGSATSSATIPEATLESGSWVHLAMSYDGSNIKVFINGSQYGSNVAKTGNIRTDSPTRLGIGVRSTGADLPFVGQIDDVKCFDIALSAATISTYSNDCSFSPSTTGLTGWWTLDNTDADSQTNITANDLVSVGSPSFTADPAYSCSVANTTNFFYMT